MNSTIKIFTKILGTLILLSISSLLLAQDVAALPNDPRIQTGKLPNGLTYYVVKNSAIKGYADFSISQKVGTVQEGDNEKGMLKMIELLATRGTRNFTDSTITQYFRSINVDDSDVKFNTRAEDLTYKIENVPVVRENVIDSTLLVLYNWLGSINIDEEDINKVMPVLKNTIADEYDAEGRMNQLMLKNLFPQAEYSNKLQMSKVDKMKPYSSKDVRKFYYKWFRPDLQAVFVVGDIDATAVANKIKSTFSIIPKPMAAIEKESFIPDKFSNVKVLIEEDPEYNKTKVTINFLTEPLLQKYRNSTVPYIQEFMNSAIESLLDNRIDNRILSQSLPIINVSINQGSFMGILNSNNFSFTFETQPDMVYSAITFFSTEIDRLARYGFTNEEFDASKSIYFRALENTYVNRAHLDNDFYYNRVERNFLEGYTLASVEMNFEVIRGVLSTLTLDQINSYTKELLGQDDNIVITCQMPKVKDGTQLSESRVLSSFSDALALSPAELGVNNSEAAWTHFREPIHKAIIVSELLDNKLGTYMFKLSNGATVVLKNLSNSNDVIRFTGLSKGGISLMDGVNIGNQQYLNDIINLGGLGTLSQPQLDVLYALSNMNIVSKISANTESLEGYVGNEYSLERLFQSINLNMTSRRADDDAFNVYKKSKVYESLYYRLSPLDVFKDSIAYYNNSNKNYVKASSAQQIEAIKYNPILNASKERFSNASDFTFIFAGNVDLEKFKALALKYIGSIPRGNDGDENWLVLPNYYTKGKHTTHFLHQMVVPRTYVSVTQSLGVDYSIESSVLSKIMSEYLNRLYINGSIKNLSSKSKLESNLLNYPEKIAMYSSTFETDSAGAGAIINILDNSLSDISKNGVNVNLYSSIKKDLASKFAAESAKSSYWVSVLAERSLSGIDLHSSFLEVLDKITPEIFSNYVTRLINEGNEIVVIMEGTKDDVQSKKLLKENKFIRDFFEL